jgi:CubicO group peptidase (beta-lactamase class C family)
MTNNRPLQTTRACPFRIRGVLLTLILLFPLMKPLAQTPATEPRDLGSILEPIRKKGELPSLAAAVIKGDQLVGHGAVGVRKLGDPTPVTLQDKYHLGSCTKTMTATLAAILVEEGTIDWDTTIGDVFDGKIRVLHEGYRAVTLEQLLAHVGGFATKPPTKTWIAAWAEKPGTSPTKQRQHFVTDLLKGKPTYPAGSKTVYSNQGYAVAGLMLEMRAKKSWEDLIRDSLFTPLGMQHAGFRAPGTGKTLDHPLGHNEKKKPIAPEPKGDNPASIAPAGAVHTTIDDWARFARFHLQRKPGPILKEAASFDKLHSTLPNSATHGVGGWLVHDIPSMGGHCLQMVGSNTMWYSIFWVIPGSDMAIVVTTNSGQPNAFETCDQAVAAILKEFRK